MHLGLGPARESDQYVRTGCLSRIRRRECLDNLNLRGYEDKKRFAVSETLSSVVDRRRSSL